jgi:hypothetical protein
VVRRMPKRCGAILRPIEALFLRKTLLNRYLLWSD